MQQSSMELGKNVGKKKSKELEKDVCDKVALN